MPTSVISVDQLDLNNTIQQNTTDTSNYFADNGIIRADFIQTGNTVKYTSKGRAITWVPQNMRYIDSLGMEDSIYSVQDVPLETKANYARFNRTMPDIDDWFIVENDQVKHQILVQGFQRDPMPYLTDPINFAIGGQLIFDADLTVRSMGMTLTGAFQTGDSIQLCDGDDVIFTLPQVVAYDSKIPERAQTTGFYNVTTNQAGNLQFDIVLDNAWVSDVARVYPLVIDPTVIVSSAYDISGVGARKVLHLSNGWIVIVAYNATNGQVVWYFSSDNGSTFNLLTYSSNTFGSSIATIAMASSGTTVYTVGAATALATVYLYKFDATTVAKGINYTSTVTSDASIDSVTIALDSVGDLHVGYGAKVSPYTNSINAKYTESNDGGTTWSSATQISTLNTAGQDVHGLNILVTTSNNPILFGQYANNAIMAWIYSGGTWSSHQVYSGVTYNQASPCGVEDGNGVKFVGWHGADATTANNRARWSKSTDGGNTWSAMALINPSSTNASTNVTFVVRPDNSVDAFWNEIDSAISATYLQIRRANLPAGSSTWSAPVTITNNTTADAKNPQTLWSKYNMNSSDAIRYMWQDMQASSVKYDSITLNSPPNAPTLTAHGNFDATVAQTLAWMFSDPDSGNTQSAYELQIYDTTNLTTPVIDTGKVGSTASSYALAANALTQGKNYQWRVQTWDQSGAQGPYSGYSTFKTSAAPVATITAPTSGATVISDSYTFTGGYTQPNGVTEQSFQFKLWNQAGTTVVQDSGTIVGTSNAKTFTGLSNNTSYQVEFIVTSQDGVTASSGKVPFSVAYTPPATPAATTSNDATNSRVMVTFSNPTPSGSQPTVSSNNVYRRKTGDTTWTLLQQGATSPYYDYTCPVGSHDYGVTGVSSAGAVSDYGISTVSTSFDGEWLIDESNSANNVVFLYNQRKSDATVNQSYTPVQTFAKYPRIRKGQARYRTGNLTALKLSQDGDVISQVDAIDNMCNSDNTYLLKSVNGRIYRVSLSQFKYTGKYGNSTADCSVVWTEVGDV